MVICIQGERWISQLFMGLENAANKAFTSPFILKLLVTLSQNVAMSCTMNYVFPAFSKNRSKVKQ